MAGHDPSPGAERLEARDLLFEHRADERIEDEIGAAQAQAGMTMREVGDALATQSLSFGADADDENVAPPWTTSGDMTFNVGDRGGTDVGLNTCGGTKQQKGKLQETYNI